MLPDLGPILGDLTGVDLAVKELHIPPRICGIYFLICQSEVVYIGQSVEMVGRIRGHIYARVKAFTRVLFIECDEVELDRVETTLILHFKPRYNGRVYLPALEDVVRGREWVRLMRETAYSVILGRDGGIDEKTLSWVVGDESDRGPIHQKQLARIVESDHRVRWDQANLVFVLI